MEGTRKRARPRKRWRGEVEEDLNIIGGGGGVQCREWRKVFIGSQGAQRTVVLEEEETLA